MYFQVICVTESGPRINFCSFLYYRFWKNIRAQEVEVRKSDAYRKKWDKQQIWKIIKLRYSNMSYDAYGIMRSFISIFCQNPLIFKDGYCWNRKITVYQVVIICLLREEMNLPIKMDPECSLENLLHPETKKRNTA